MSRWKIADEKDAFIADVPWNHRLSQMHWITLYDWNQRSHVTSRVHILSALQHRLISSIDIENWRIHLIKKSSLMAESAAVCQPFTAEQLDEFHEVFSFFDRCTTGLLQLNELGLILRSVGFNPSDTTIRQYQENYQAQGIDQINFEQFVQILMDFNRTREDEIDLIEAFRVFDQDGHGRKP